MSRARHLDDLVALGSMPTHAAAFLDAAVSVALNALVAGSAQDGKTTSCQYARSAHSRGQGRQPDSCSDHPGSGDRPQGSVRISPRALVARIAEGRAIGSAWSHRPP